MGAQIDEGQLKKILNYVEIGKEEGATVACGGVREETGELAKGCFMRPTLLTNVTNDMRVAQEEIFGPVAVVIKFKDEDDVIAMANDSVYGLGGAVLDPRISTGRSVWPGALKPAVCGSILTTPFLKARPSAAIRSPASAAKRIRLCWSTILR